MREHPIPQDITNYRFHIIGSMTLRQFAEVAAGVVVAMILYKTNLIAIVKWPLIGISVGLGAATAFLPIEERPLDHWLVTFIRVLYRPTQYFWKRTQNIPKAFQYQGNQQLQTLEPEIDLSPARRQRIKDYLGSVTKTTDEPYSLTGEEQNRVADILNSFNSVPVQSTAPQQIIHVADSKPDLEVRVRKLRPQHSAETVVYEVQTPQPEVVSTPTNLSLTPLVTPNSIPTPVTYIEPQIAEPSPAVVSPEIIDQPEPVTPQELHLQDETSTPQTTTPIQVAQISPHQAQSVPTQAVAYNSDLPFPSTPTEPNKIVGMVLTPNNDLVSEAIVEIQTADGNVARAVKTNALGQFFITTPLANGEYTVVVERDGLSFSPLQLSLSNQIVHPIEIRSS